MSYLALYRRFRPKTFDKVIGQDVVVKTLTNQINNNMIGHAYLFCGARGTGKTSLAKIFAKAVNCHSPINGSPCDSCESCKLLNDSSNIDVIEIDAASNNSVDNVREIRDNVQYPPVGLKYKVYIIDEVHMLSPGAFNALLKTLEEPPKHAIFILATTEPQKLPATILSRCMRFDFKLVSLKSLTNLIKEIYDEISKKYTEEAVMAIAKAGEGSVRDALSVADLCVSVGGDKLTYDDVLSILGATDIEKTNSLVTAIINGDVGKILSITDDILSLGKSISVLSKDLISFIRDLIVIKLCNNSKEILTIPEEKFKMLSATANLCVESRLLRILEILSSLENSLKFTSQPRSVFEACVIKSAMLEVDYDLTSLLTRINELELEIKTLKNTGVKVVEKVIEKEVAVNKVENEEVANNNDTQIQHKAESAISENKNTSELPNSDSALNITNEMQTKLNEELKSVANQNVDGKRIWGTVVRKLRNTEGKTILWVACQEMSATVSGNTLLINAGSESGEKLLQKEENLSFISEIVKTFGNFEIKLLNGNEVQTSQNKEKVAEFFGETLEIK